MDQSIVIVNWNTRHHLARCLESVRLAIAKVSAEVWVVDNASTDDSVDMLRQCFPEVRLIVNDRNLGFAAANNQAYRQSTGRYVLLLNSDTEVDSAAPARLMEFMDGHPDAGAAGPLVLNTDGSLQESCYRLPTLFRCFWSMFHLDRLLSLATYRMKEWDRMAPRRVDTIQGSCMMLRREALDPGRVLDDLFFMYSEEVDLCHRLANGGWSVWWVPQARIVHYGGRSSRQANEAMFEQLYRSKYLFFRKTRGPVVALVYKLILLLASVARVVFTPAAYLLPEPRRGHALLKSGQYRRLIGRLFRL